MWLWCLFVCLLSGQYVVVFVCLLTDQYVVVVFVCFLTGQYVVVVSLQYPLPAALSMMIHVVATGLI